MKGKYEIVGTDKIRITELPVGFWTNDFKEYLEESNMVLTNEEIFKIKNLFYQKMVEYAKEILTQ